MAGSSRSYRRERPLLLRALLLRDALTLGAERDRGALNEGREGVLVAGARVLGATDREKVCDGVLGAERDEGRAGVLIAGARVAGATDREKVRDGVRLVDGEGTGLLDRVGVRMVGLLTEGAGVLVIDGVLDLEGVRVGPEWNDRGAVIEGGVGAERVVDVLGDTGVRGTGVRVIDPGGGATGERSTRVRVEGRDVLGAADTVLDCVRGVAARGLADRVVTLGLADGTRAMSADGAAVRSDRTEPLWPIPAEVVRIRAVAVRVLNAVGASMVTLRVRALRRFEENEVLILREDLGAVDANVARPWPASRVLTRVAALGLVAL